MLNTILTSLTNQDGYRIAIREQTEIPTSYPLRFMTHIEKDGMFVVGHYGMNLPDAHKDYVDRCAVEHCLPC